MTEIVKSTSTVDSKPVWVVKGAIITYIDEEKNGVVRRGTSFISFQSFQSFQSIENIGQTESAPPFCL